MTKSETPAGRRVVCLYANWETQERLSKWAKDVGFDLGWSYSGWPQHSAAFSFHVTLVASTNKVDLEPGARWVDPVTLEPEGFVELGVDRRVPTLAVAQNGTLDAMRAFFVNAYEIKPTFDKFKPHVSLSYRWDGEPALNAIGFPPGPLVFDRLVIGVLEDKPQIHDASRGANAMHFTDKAAVSGTRETKDGYLVADCRVARAGIQEYYGAEIGLADKEAEKLFRLYRPADEVFKASALATFAFRPVTVDHPVTDVTAANWKELAVGTTGGEVVRDGEFVRVPLVLMDGAAIEAVRNGKREISMGYDATLDWTPGVTPAGEPYDAVMRDIRNNHCAVVDAGRAGPKCRVGDRVSHQTEKEPSMTKIIVDGKTIEVSDEVASLVGGLQKDVQKYADVLASVEKVLPGTLGVIDTLKADLAAKEKAISEERAKVADLEKKVPTEADIAKMAADRAALVDTAKKIAPDLEPGDKAAADIRRAVVAAKLGDAAVKDRSDEAVTAMFDTLASVAAKDGNEADPVRDAIASGAAGAKISGRDKYIADLASAYKS